MESRRENPHFSKNARLKYCFVPGCYNCALKNPEKIFLTVPKGENRVKWLSQVRREPGSLSLQSTMYCCEDHFNVQEDLDNYMRVKLDASAKIQLKKGVLPRFFNCQPDREHAHTTPIRKLRRTQSREADAAPCASSSFVNRDSSRFEDEELNGSMLEQSSAPPTKDVGVQVSFKAQKPHFRSKYVQCNLQSDKHDEACSLSKNTNTHTLKKIKQKNENFV